MKRSKVLLAFMTIVCWSVHAQVPLREQAYEMYADYSYNGIARALASFPYLDGADVVIGQKEHVANIASIDLYNKIYLNWLSSTLSTTHATYVATIMAGNGTTNPLLKGIAPATKIVSTSFDTFYPAPDTFYTTHKVSIINHSYGNEVTNWYSEEAAAIDAQVNRLPYLLHVFSSGNSGNLPASMGFYNSIEGFGNLTGSYKQSKNSLSIGAYDENYQVVESSSKGPAYDGRVKPELVTYSKAGTSYSAAVVSASMALLQQAYFLSQKKLPSSALLKAVTCGTADDIHSKGIDYASGYGSLNIYQSIKAVTATHYKELILKKDESIRLNFTLPAHLYRAKFTVAWVDPAAKMGATKALENDVDCSVEKDVIRWFPQVLSDFPLLDSLKRLARQGIDTLNTVEQIVLEYPKEGNYILTIDGSKLKTATQELALVWHFDEKDTIEWNYPVQSSFIIAKENVRLQWKHTFSRPTYAQLYFKPLTSEPAHWIDSVEVTKEMYEWQAPPTFSKGSFYLSVNERHFETDTFTISPQLYILPIAYCHDTLVFRWQSNLNSTDSEIEILEYQKNTTQWQHLYTTSEPTSTFMLPAIQPDDWVSIRALKKEHTGIRSIAYSISKEPIQCFYKLFTIEVDNLQPLVTLELTAGDLVDNITFQYKRGDSFENVATYNIIQQNFYKYLDNSHLSSGEHTYRAVIRLTNGKVVITEERTIWILGKETEILVFPNPSENGSTFFIKTNYVAFRYELIDLAGKLLLADYSNAPSAELGIQLLPAGTYFLRIIDELDNRIHIKKLIKK